MQAFVAQCRVNIARNFSCPSKQSLVAHLFSHRSWCHVPRLWMSSVAGAAAVVLNWTLHRQEQGGPAQLSFLSLELPCCVGFNMLMLWDLFWHQAQIWHWNCDLKRKMRGQQSHWSFEDEVAKIKLIFAGLTYFFDSGMLEANAWKPVCSTQLDFTSFLFCMFSWSPLHLQKIKPKMCVLQVKTLWHVRSAGPWQRFTLASWNASAWVTWTPRETGATPKTT